MTTMSFPPIPLEWATDDNYDAGADPWSGTPTKVDPTTQSKTKGFIPETTASGQQLNYLLNKFAHAANAMANAILSRWSAPVIFPATFSTAASTYYFSTSWFNKRNRAWYKGAGSAGSDVYRSRNLIDWTAAVSGIGNTQVCGAVNNNTASAKYGDMVVSSESASLLRKYDYATATWSSLTFTGSHTCFQLAHDAVNGKWIELHVVLGGGGAVGCRNAPDTTYVWTDRTLGGTPTGTQGTGRDPYLVVSDTGIAVVAGMSATTMWVSSDGGSTWTVVTPSIVPKTEHSLVWVPGSQEFLYYGTDGKIYSSPDGLTWGVKVATTPFGGTAGITGAGGYITSMAAIGSTVFCIWATASGQGGAGFSTDGGLTWEFAYGISTTETAGTTGARGKLYVGDDTVLATHINGPAATVGNGYAVLRGMARVPLAIFP